MIMTWLLISISLISQDVLADTAVWSKWAQWSECSASCGHAVRYRLRLCSDEDESKCKGLSTEHHACDTIPCSNDYMTEDNALLVGLMGRSLVKGIKLSDLAIDSPKPTGKVYRVEDTTKYNVKSLEPNALIAIDNHTLESSDRYLPRATKANYPSSRDSNDGTSHDISKRDSDPASQEVFLLRLPSDYDNVNPKMYELIKSLRPKHKKKYGRPMKRLNLALLLFKEQLLNTAKHKTNLKSSADELTTDFGDPARYDPRRNDSAISDSSTHEDSVMGLTSGMLNTTTGMSTDISAAINETTTTPRPNLDGMANFHMTTPKYSGDPLGNSIILAGDLNFTMDQLTPASAYIRPTEPRPTMFMNATMEDDPALREAVIFTIIVGISYVMVLTVYYWVLCYKKYVMPREDAEAVSRRAKIMKRIRGNMQQDPPVIKERKNTIPLIAHGEKRDSKASVKSNDGLGHYHLMKTGDRENHAFSSSGAVEEVTSEDALNDPAISAMPERKDSGQIEVLSAFSLHSQPADVQLEAEEDQPSEENRIRSKFNRY